MGNNPLITNAVSTPSAVGNTGSRTLFLVDDDNQLATTIQEAFQNAGWKVLHCCDGAEATRQLNQPIVVNLVVVNMLLPSISGFQIVQQLRSRYRPDLPIIMISDLGSAAHHDYALSLGISAFLMKPIRTAELQQTAEELVPSTE